jgi:uncharacterized protein (TIGR03067 family)
MRSLALAMVFASFVVADDKDDLKAMTGTWVVEKMTVEGSDFTSTFAEMSLVIEGEKYTVTFGGMTDKGTFKIDVSKTPKTMDITGAEGPNKGKTYPCIYEIKDGKVTICYGMADKRPEKFESTKESKTMLAVYKKK